ncbi:class II fructose-bisphosphate aldolase [Mycolicibacterium sp. P9-64]|uniref:class II fructose-bisphosphate aldolase n=1 Tax=Mycolicibacterium sp. P9-64 TaxID=2024612 RepID=UPI0011F02D40|nr:class II fructose-bisphosphate aldolase [Mycolicibacterium sp. P9-64]KAA0085415.1 class II fructose-bisphosphate aldolase [Mycolicibacterium sp. P9-64]
MTLAATADLVASAAETGTAVLAFNVITLEHAEGIADGAERARVAAVLQLSENTIRFHGGRIAPLLAACAQIATHSSVPLSIHLDHFQDVALINDAIEIAANLGASSIMIDAAHLPYRDNVERTRTLSERAHAAGLWVEAELGEVGGKDGQHKDAHAPGARTDPAEAAAFAAETAVDGLAVAVGSSHAMTTRDATLDIELIDAIASAVGGGTRVPLVLHGSSGVPDDQLRLAIRAGIRKVNVGTALNVAYTGAIRQALTPVATDPRAFLTAGRDAISDAVAQLCLAVAGERVAR